MAPIIRDFSAQGVSADALVSLIKSGRIPHALLITGEPGTGKRTFAYYLAALLLCGNDGDRPCGKCESCLQIIDGGHPDLTVIEAGHPIAPDADSGLTTISVKDIREMIRITSLRSLTGGYKVVLFPDASKIQPLAQNMLLKSLEEPPDRVCFILVTSRREKILPTVVSRCRPFEMKLWDDKHVETHLLKSGVAPQRAREIARASRGSVGRAVKMASDENILKIHDEALHAFFGIGAESEAIRVANAWKGRKEESGLFLETAEYLLSEIMRARFSVAAGPINNDRCSEQWREMSSKGGEQSFARLFDALNMARRKLEANANLQAVLEEVLICFLEESRKCLKS